MRIIIMYVPLTFHLFIYLSYLSADLSLVRIVSLHMYRLCLGRIAAHDDPERTLCQPIVARINAGRQSGESQSTFACSRSESRASASPRIRQSDLPSALFIRAAGRVAFPCLRSGRRCNPPTFRGIRRVCGSGVDRISPVIYSTRVGDVPASSVVIRVVRRHSGCQGKTRVERALKRGRGPTAR